MIGFAPLTSRGSQQYRALTVPELTQQMFGMHANIHMKAVRTGNNQHRNLGVDFVLRQV
eukprot:gene13850-21373_t